MRRQGIKKGVPRTENYQQETELIIMNIPKDIVSVLYIASLCTKYRLYQEAKPMCHEECKACMFTSFLMHIGKKQTNKKRTTTRNECTIKCKTLGANPELQCSPVPVLPNQDQLQTMRGRCISDTNLPTKLNLRSRTKR